MLKKIEDVGINNSNNSIKKKDGLQKFNTMYKKGHSPSQNSFSRDKSKKRAGTNLELNYNHSSQEKSDRQHKVKISPRDYGKIRGTGSKAGTMVKSKGNVVNLEKDRKDNSRSPGGKRLSHVGKRPDFKH